MQIKGLGLGGLMAIVALVGCGSSSGTGGTGGSTGTGGGTGSGKGGTTGSGGSFTTSVPSGTKVTGLTAGQAAQLCSDVESYVDNSFFPAICRAAMGLSGPEAAYLDLLQNPTASTAELQAACASAAATDAGNSCSNPLGDGGTQTCNISQVPSTCQATVGDYTKCVNDSTAADLQLYASAPTCSTLTAASLMAYFAADGGSSANPAQPASCSMFDSTCTVDGGTSITSSMSLRMRPKGSR
jgi:hypothetical protein